VVVPPRYPADEHVAAFACQMLRLADHFMLDELRQRCEGCLSSMVDVLNACDLLQLADSCHAPQLVATCRFHILSMHHLVVETEAWKTMSQELKKDLL
jgi:hypothetical protein